MNEIEEAAAKNDLKSVTYLVEKHGIEESIIELAAHVAAKNGNSDIVKYLLSKDPSLIKRKNNWNQTVLHFAVEKGDLELVKYLVEKYNADVYESNILMTGGSALHIAAAAGKLDIFKYLIEEKNMNPDLKDALQQTAAFIAADVKDLPIIKYLAENTKANLTMLDEERSNILYRSARNDDLDILRYLLDEVKLNFDINWKNRLGDTVLHCAAAHNAGGTVKYLVNEKHAQMNIQNNKGHTALYKASSEGFLEIVKYLVENGADAAITDFKKQTPLAVSVGSEVNLYLTLEENNRKRRIRRSVFPVRHSASVPSTSIRMIATNEITWKGSLNGRRPTSIDNVERSSQLNSFLILAIVCYKYVWKRTKFPPSQQQSIRARIDPVAIDTVTAFPFFERL